MATPLLGTRREGCERSHRQLAERDPLGKLERGPYVHSKSPRKRKGIQTRVGKMKYSQVKYQGRGSMSKVLTAAALSSRSGGLAAQVAGKAARTTGWICICVSVSVATLLRLSARAREKQRSLRGAVES
eukprot:535694-Pleurochrysis_carterae.AAC.1